MVKNHGVDTEITTKTAMTANSMKIQFRIKIGITLSTMSMSRENLFKILPNKRNYFLEINLSRVEKVR